MSAKKTKAKNLGEAHQLTLSTKVLFGLSLVNSTRTAVIEWLLGVIARKNQPTALVMTPNPEMIVQAADDKVFASDLRQADVLLPDGSGLIWAGQWLGQTLKERVAGVDVVSELLKAAGTQHFSILVLGGRGYEGREITLLRDATQKQQFKVWWTEGYKDVSHPLPHEEREVRQLIKDVEPAVICVAFGAPQQERWMVEHRELCRKEGVKVVMAVGGSFDYLTGKVGRAPAWARALSLEWLYRLIRQPWRWRRQLRLIRFVVLTLLQHK